MIGLVLVWMSLASLLASPLSRHLPGIHQLSATRAAASDREVKIYGATLTGEQQVPPTGSVATGVARLQLLNDGSIRWSLHTRGLENVVAAHIHAGAPGLNGPPVITLFSGDPTSDLHLEGAITDPSQAAVVLQLIQNNTAYVNVHTTAFQNGEIRGQLEPKASPAGRER